MKKTLFAALLVVAAGAASAATYTIDSHHANARFAIDHFGATTTVIAHKASASVRFCGG